MARKKRGGAKPLPDDVLRERINIWRECGHNTSEAARRIGLTRQQIQRNINAAVERELITHEECNPSNLPTFARLDEAVERKIRSFEAKRAKGTWRKPSLIHIAPGPFMLKIFGDPHLDADACDIDLFMSEWRKMDEAKSIYGLCVGDFFNNWTRSLAHLWKHEGDPTDAWVIFEHLMEERGAALLAACSGNHDDWTQAPYDPIEMVMRRYGARYRMGAITLAIFDGSHVTSVAMRHKWRGNSMYSAAHGLLRGALHGWNDDLLIGGHTHQSEIRHYCDAKDGTHSLLVQIEAFKRFDDYVDVHGFMGQSIAPVLNVVVDPSKPATYPDRLKHYWDHDEAALALERLRG